MSRRHHKEPPVQPSPNAVDLARDTACIKELAAALTAHGCKANLVTPPAEAACLDVRQPARYRALRDHLRRQRPVLVVVGGADLANQRRDQRRPQSRRRPALRGSPVTGLATAASHAENAPPRTILHAPGVGALIAAMRQTELASTPALPSR